MFCPPYVALLLRSREDPSERHSCTRGLCSFPHTAIFIPSAVGERQRSMGARTEKKTCRVTEWAAWYRSRGWEGGGGGLPGRVDSGGGSLQLLSATGKPHPHLSALLAESNWSLQIQENTHTNRKTAKNFTYCHRSKIMAHVILLLKSSSGNNWHRAIVLRRWSNLDVINLSMKKKKVDYSN